MIYNARVPLAKLKHMRALLVAALVFVAALAGCSGKKGDAEDFLTHTCTDGKVISEEDYEGVLADNATDSDVINFLKTKCKASGTGTKTNSTSLAPNKLPILVLNVTDFAGNATKVTMLNGNLTFSAAGSSDPDGHVTAIAISVTDSNTTRTKALYDGAKKQFTPAMFSFDRPGIVNVTVAMVDDRAGFNNSVFQVYVNHPQVLVGGVLAVPGHQAPAGAHACQGASSTPLGGSGPIVHAQYYTEKSFTVVAGASFVEADPDASTRITICDPAGTAISPEKSADPVQTNPDVVLTPPPSTDNYYIGFYGTTANANVGALVVVHYEPREAAPAA